MKDMVDESLSILNGGGDLMPFGELLHEAWQAKRSLSQNVSNPEIDDMYTVARDAGACGGKITGAGGVGFLLLFVAEERQQQVREALRDLIHVPFRFEFGGSQIIFFDHQQDYSAEETARATQAA